MLKDERLERIVDHVDKNGYAAVTELVAACGFSKATIRRDLEELARQGRLSLTRGGARARSKGMSFEPSYVEKRQANSDEKARIAREAAALVRDGDTIIIDSGTTCIEVPQFLHDRHVTAATNDLMVALELGKCPHIETIVVGGVLRPHFYSLSSHYAVSFIGQCHFDRAFVSLDSIQLDKGLMITNMDEVSAKRAIIDSATEVVALCDHTKFEVCSFVGVYGVERLDRIITGRELDEKTHQAFLDKGLNITLV